MKALKWVFGVLLVLVLIIGIGTAALVYLVNWNDFRDTIQNQTKKHTGRDLIIAGDLKPSVFPWVGVSIGDISLANAEGFGDAPFAKMGSADVKVELLPLLKKVVNIRTVDLQGLTLDLQRAEDGTTNWDDLVNSSSATTTTTETDGTSTEVEVEGDTAAIAALAVGGISITDANVSWNDAQSGTDAKLADFNLKTGAIELAKPFALSTEFDLASNSMGLAANVVGAGEVMIDLENQTYSLSGLELTTNATGESLPGGKLDAVLGATVMAKLADQQISVESLSLDALGLILSGKIDVVNLDTLPTVSGQLSSNEFSPLDLFAKLGIEAPVTADADVLKKASLSMVLNATPESATLNDLTIKLDDTTFSGNASVPSLAAAIPPVRFKFGVDAIDIDRYLPPVVEGEVVEEEATGPVATGDEPIELPLEMMRQLDVDGEFSVGSVKVMNLTTKDILVPLTAKSGVIKVNGLRASMYEGALNSSATINATGDTPSYAAQVNLSGIEADPLLADLMQKDSFLSGNGLFAANITAAGNTVNSIKAGLNGEFNTAFNDGSINGVNIGYQIRRAKAVLSGKSLPEDAKQVKTDFSTFSVSGNFTNGVMNSTDLDMRSPLLRVGGAGQVDLPGEQVDYTMTTLITGTAQGQGGEDLEALKGVTLEIPIKGSFDDLSANFAGVILAGMKANIANNLKGQVEARAKAEAEKLKAQAQQKLEEGKAKAQEQLEAKKAEAQEKAAEAIEKNKSAVEDKVKNKLKGLLK